jgi:hypothetical protein
MSAVKFMSVKGWWSGYPEHSKTILVNPAAVRWINCDVDGHCSLVLDYESVFETEESLRSLVDRLEAYGVATTKILL